MMTDGQKMVWAAEFVRDLAELMKYQPPMEAGEDREEHDSRIEEWRSACQHSAAEKASGIAAMLPELAVSMAEGWDEGDEPLVMVQEMAR